MREFTPEEKELIASTPITAGSFDVQERPFSYDTANSEYHNLWGCLIRELELLRMAYKETKKECYFTEFVRLLPNSYKVVKL